jgi:hypothetical protein
MASVNTPAVRKRSARCCLSAMAGIWLLIPLVWGELNVRGWTYPGTELPAETENPMILANSALGWERLRGCCLESGRAAVDIRDAAARARVNSASGLPGMQPEEHCADYRGGLHTSSHTGISSSHGAGRITTQVNLDCWHPWPDLVGSEHQPESDAQGLGPTWPTPPSVRRRYPMQSWRTVAAIRCL